MKWLRSLWPDVARYDEDTLTLMKRKAVEAGLDPMWFDEIANQPCCPGSLGSGDPGRLNGCKPGCPNVGPAQGGER